MARLCRRVAPNDTLNPLRTQPGDIVCMVDDDHVFSSSEIACGQYQFDDLPGVPQEDLAHLVEPKVEIILGGAGPEEVMVARRRVRLLSGPVAMPKPSKQAETAIAEWKALKESAKAARQVRDIYANHCSAVSRVHSDALFEITKAAYEQGLRDKAEPEKKETPVDKASREAAGAARLAPLKAQVDDANETLKRYETQAKRRESDEADARAAPALRSYVAACRAVLATVEVVV